MSSKIERKFTKNSGRKSLLVRYLEIFASSESAANFFSKIRLSFNEPFKKSEYQGKLHYWCPNFDEELLYFYKIQLPYQNHNIQSIPFYQISFQDAELLECPENLLEYYRFVILKDYFAAKRFRIILNSNIPSTLIYAHDPEIIDEMFNHPILLSTTREMTTSLSDMIRGFWSLEYSSNRYVKLPAFHGHLLENDLVRFNRPISLHYRNYVVCNKKVSDSSKYFTPRRFILNKDKETYISNISFKTEKNLLSLAKDKVFYNKCERNQKLFRQKKLGEGKKAL